MTKVMRDGCSAYGVESEGVAALAAPFEIHVYSTKCQRAADCLSCPLKSKFQFILPDLPYRRKRRHDEDDLLACEECLIFLDKEAGNEKVRFATSGLVDKMKRFHEEQILQAKQESAALKARLETQKSVHEAEVGSLKKDLETLRLENSNLTANLEETHRKLRFLKTMDLNLKSRFSKSETITDTSFVDGACSKAMERARRYLAAGIINNPPLWARRRNSGSEKNDERSSPLIRAIIRYCQTDDISFTEKVSAEKVLKVAHLYGLQQLKDLCEKQLCTNITSDNLWEMFCLSRSFKAKGLRKEVLKFLEANADQCGTESDRLLIDDRYE